MDFSNVILSHLMTKGEETAYDVTDFYIFRLKKGRIAELIEL